MPAVSPLPFLTPQRRSHLDSACYRTLVRIFSQCLDEPLATSHRPIPNPNPTPDAPPKEPIFDRNDNGNAAVTDEPGPPKEQASSSSEESQRDKQADHLVPERPQSGDARAEASSGDSAHDAEGRSPAAEGDGNGNLSFAGRSRGGDSELLSSLDLDCSGLIDDANDEMFDAVRKLLDVDTDELHEVTQFTDFSRSPKVSADENCMSRSSHAEMLRSLEESLREEVMTEKHLECVFGGEVKGASLGRDRPDEAQVTQTETLKEVVGRIQQEILACLDTGTNSFRSEKLDGDQVRSPMGSGDVRELEEGEIPDEVQIAEDQKAEEKVVRNDFVDEGSSDSTSIALSDINCIDALNGSKEDNRREDEPDVQICEEKEWNTDATRDDRCLEPEIKRTSSNRVKANADSQDIATNVLGLIGDNLVIENEGNPSEDVGVQEKRKRGPLTEKRRAAKKNSKKRKRAEKDRLQGVKRLKLQLILKPKVVKECRHFMIGRCNQGDQCKFSHSCTPLTKSQPCKYFAKGTCLKGEDCPFDHELFKYPCVRMSQGACFRGDNCKFSHKISVTEDCSASIPSKSGSLLSSGKQLKGSASLVASMTSKSTTSSAPFLMNNNMETNVAASPKELMRVPSGVRFLSFGKETSDSVIKQGKVVLEKNGGTKIFNQENQEKIFAGGHKHAPNAGIVAHHPAINFPTCKGSMNISTVTGVVVAPFSSSIQPEVSDASKILDEFLFGSG